MNWELQRACAELRSQSAQSRRGFLQTGALAAGAAALGNLIRRQAKGAVPVSKDRSVIILWMRGGPSHIDMWDPKPDAPAEYRGEFGTMPTSVPGIQLTDMLPMSGAIMDQWAIVRSLYHHDAGHSAGDQICFTGYNSGPSPDVNIHPSCGSIVSEQLGHLTPELPSYVMIPRQVPGTDSAYLGASYKPFETQSDPASDGPFQIPNFNLCEGLSSTRLGDRRQLLAHFDRMQAEVDRTGMMDGMDRFGEQAVEILTSNRARDAFDLDAEPKKIRERYGYLPAFDPGASDRCGAPAWSQRILLARRLVEAGVRLVTVDLRWWDTHVLGFDSLRRGFLPRFDRAYSALIEDLKQRGMLESTLVVAWGEFGRTPRVNGNAGRDHYPNVFSAAIAGGATPGGTVVGSSDSKGAFPLSDPRTPQDVLAMIYHHLGVDQDKDYINASGRPIKVLPSGTPLFQ